jgi:hypothetical protein
MTNRERRHLYRVRGFKFGCRTSHTPVDIYIGMRIHKEDIASFIIIAMC